MLLHNTAHVITRTISFLLPFLFLGALGLFLIAIYDLAALDLAKNYRLFREMNLPIIIGFADHWKVLVISGLSAFGLAVTCGFASD